MQHCKFDYRKTKNTKQKPKKKKKKATKMFWTSESVPILIPLIPIVSTRWLKENTLIFLRFYPIKLWKKMF